MKIRSSIFILMLIMSGGCNFFEEKPVDGYSTIELRALGDVGFGADLFSCSKDCYSKLTSKIDTNYVINNNDDYLKFKIKVSCLEIINWPSVDFDKNTLLAGIIISPTTCCRIVKEELSYDPFNMKYTLIVTLEPGTSQTAGAVFFWGLINKLPDNTNIVFQYRYNSIL